MKASTPEYSGLVGGALPRSEAACAVSRFWRWTRALWEVSFLCQDLHVSFEGGHA